MRSYPNLNIEWLLFGKGKMYKDSESQPVNLFSDTFEEKNVAEPEIYPTISEQIFTPLPEPKGNGVTLNDIKTLVGEMQRPVNQRKLIKITAFFDDGTFQELSAL